MESTGNEVPTVREVVLGVPRIPVRGIKRERPAWAKHAPPRIEELRERVSPSPAGGDVLDELMGDRAVERPIEEGPREAEDVVDHV